MLDYYPLDVILSIDSCLFGQPMPGRNANSSEYRYGFQKQEKIDEVYSIEGSYIDYKYRGYNPRLGRFFSVDPLASKFPYWSPYQFSGNQVISSVELEGLESSNDLNSTATNSTNTPVEQRNPDIPSLPGPITFNQAQNDPQLLFNTIIQTKEVALSTGTPVNLNQVVTGLPNAPASISGNVNLRDPLPGHNKPLQAQTTFNISANSVIGAGTGDISVTPNALVNLSTFNVGGGQQQGPTQQTLSVLTSFNLQFQGGGGFNFSFIDNVNGPNVVLSDVAGGVGYFEKIYNTSLNLRDRAIQWGNTGLQPTGGTRLNLTNMLQNQMQQMNNQINQKRQSMGLPPARIGF
jgi:RHS repeat-associated protein